MLISTKDAFYFFFMQGIAWFICLIVQQTRLRHKIREKSLLDSVANSFLSTTVIISSLFLLSIALHTFICLWWILQTHTALPHRSFILFSVSYKPLFKSTILYSGHLPSVHKFLSDSIYLQAVTNGICGSNGSKQKISFVMRIYASRSSILLATPHFSDILLMELSWLDH